MTSLDQPSTHIHLLTHHLLTVSHLTHARDMPFGPFCWAWHNNVPTYLCPTPRVAHFVGHGTSTATLDAMPSSMHCVFLREEADIFLYAGAHQA